MANLLAISARRALLNSAAEVPAGPFRCDIDRPNTWAELTRAAVAGKVLPARLQADGTYRIEISPEQRATILRRLAGSNG